VAKAKMHPDGRFEILQEASSPALSAPFALALGWDDGGTSKNDLVQRLQAELRRGTPTEARMVEMARTLLASAAASSPKVGGPSHIAVVDRSGSHWRSRPRDLHWDGTNLTVISANLTIGSNGVHISPATTVDSLRM
jgi:hypothetical protein